MSETTPEKLKRFVDAAKLDMLDLLNKPTLNIFEFRRIAALCDIMIDLCNTAAGGTIYPQAITDAMWKTEEGQAPLLHQALGGHVFDADELLKEKYKAMARDHAQMRYQTASAKLAERDFERGRTILSSELENLMHEQAGLAAERQLMAGQRAELEKRELALSAGEARLKQLSSGASQEVTDAEIVEDTKKEGDAS